MRHRTSLRGVPPIALTLWAGLTTGCRIVDQTTFAPEPEPPLPAQIAASAQKEGRVPLLTIGYETPNPSYEDLLRYAIQASQRRDPNLEYDVVSVIPANATAAVANQGRRDAADVMRAIMMLGVPDTRIHLGARTDPAVAVRQVRVYVR